MHEKINPANLNQFLVKNKVRVCGLGTNDEDIEKFFVEKLLEGQAEAYRSGVIKNIIGRGISKKQYYLSIVFTISAAYLLVMLLSSIIMGVIAASKFGMDTNFYPSYYSFSIIARILFVMAHISFAVTMTILIIIKPSCDFFILS